MKFIEKWKSQSDNRRHWILVLLFIIILGVLPRLNLPTPIPFPKQYPLKNGTYEQGAKAYKDGKYGMALANFIYSASYKSDIRSMSMAARMYVYAEGVQRDICQATYWSDMAARDGSSLDQVRLSIAYYYGYGIEVDDEKAYLWAKIAVENKNKAETIKWYKKLTGVTVDPPEKWYKYIKDGYDQKQITAYDAKYVNWNYKTASPAKIIRIHRIPFIGISSTVECSHDILH